MTIFKVILIIIATGLIILGAASALALFNKALSKNKNTLSDTNLATLWGLFLIGLAIGTTLMWFALPNSL